MAAVAVLFAVTGPDFGHRRERPRITRRHPNIRVEGLPELPGSGARERLVTLDHLRDDGMISAEEYARQRKRILDNIWASLTGWRRPRLLGRSCGAGVAVPHEDVVEPIPPVGRQLGLARPPRLTAAAQ